MAEIPPEFRQLETSHNILIVGGAPTQDEVRDRRAFSNGHGKILWFALKGNGVNRNEVACAYLIPYQSIITKKSFAEQEMNNHFLRLKEVVDKANPNIILLLGYGPLRAAWGKEPPSISAIRGTIFECKAPASPFYGRKCLATFHHSDVCKDWSNQPLFSFDMRRCVKESSTKEVVYPQRTLVPTLPAQQCVEALAELYGERPVALDIEGGVDGVNCISFANRPDYAFNIPLQTFDDAELRLVLPALANFLRSTTPKVLQNSLYDNFVLSWLLKSPILNVAHDTMLSSWEIFPELPKALGVQTSIWTDEPYYKSERITEDLTQYFTYCCKDSAVTIEINQKHIEHLKQSPSAFRHYQLNISLLPAILYVELRGINYDQGRATIALDGVMREIYSLEKEINEISGKATNEAIKEVNVRSPDQIKTLLYKSLMYPEQVKTIKKDEIKTETTTTDVGALLELKKTFTGEKHIVLDKILRHRHLEGLHKQLASRTDNDGRMRASYNVVGTETGRLSCSKSPTGYGANLQTITSNLRYLYCADPGHYFFQCDLAGADGWTVAAHCARLGDPTMLEDYHAGIKPAKVIALMYKHGQEVNSYSRSDILEASKGITEKGDEGWLYFACKRVQHGTNYGLGKDRMADQILKDSFKKMGTAISVAPSDCARLQKLYIDNRYSGVKKWQRWVKEQVERNGQMECASGHTRTFFGRRQDHETYMQALAHEPQANTTFATNMAISRLWNDSENRIGRKLRIEPLHQVHDAVCGQFKQEDTEWACAKIRSYFNNPIRIAGLDIVIPFDGGYGANWGTLKNPL